MSHNGQRKMKFVGTILILLILTIILPACSGLPLNPKTNLNTRDIETAQVIVRTALAETQTAFPVNTPTPSPLPTFAVPTIITSTPQDAYPGGYSVPPMEKLDYAMTVAPKIYTLLPFINEETLYGEYSGCVETTDFANFVTYVVSLPLESVTQAFEKYFQTESWGFTDPTSELVGSEQNMSKISYDVYRILPEGVPAFERLRVSLEDQSLPRGQDYINVRVQLTHIETKMNFQYLPDMYCGFNGTWLWIRLFK